jgi:hypothetical protein
MSEGEAKAKDIQGGRGGGNMYELMNVERQTEGEG